MAHGTWHSGTSAAAAAAAQMACHVFAKLGKFPYSVFVIRYSLLSPLYDVELDFAACDFNIERARRGAVPAGGVAVQKLQVESFYKVLLARKRVACVAFLLLLLLPATTAAANNNNKSNNNAGQKKEKTG